MEELEAGEIENETVEEFLISLRKEFGGGEKEYYKTKVWTDFRVRVSEQK